MGTVDKPESESDSRKHYPLSALQISMLRYKIHHEGTAVYVSPMLISLREKIDEHYLQIAFDQLLARYEILRSSILITDDLKDAKLKIHKHVSCKLILKDISAIPSKNQIAEIEQYIDKWKKKNFILDKPPLMNIHLLKLGECDFRLLWIHHHAILSGNCVSTLVTEWLHRYDALKNDQAILLTPTKPYSAYIDTLERFDTDQAKAHWTKQLCGYKGIDELQLPSTSLQAPAFIRRIATEISEKDKKKLEIFSKQNDVTANTVIQMAWGILLTMYYQTDDVVFGSVRGFPRDEVQGNAGMFINVLPMRMLIDSECTVIKCLQHIRKQQNKIREFIHTPITDLHTWSEVEEGKKLFTAAIDYKPHYINDMMWKLGEHWLERKCEYNIDTEYELTLEVFGECNRLVIRLGYNSNKFQEEYIRELLEVYISVLKQLLSSKPQRKIIELKCLPIDIYRRFIHNWSGRSYLQNNDNKTAIKIFEEIVNLHPNNIAVYHQGTEITYERLNAHANAIARYLRKNYIKNNTPILLFNNRNINMILGMLAIGKSGVSFSPVEITQPLKRVLKIIENSRCCLALSHEPHGTLLREALDTSENFSTQVLDINALSAIAAEESNENLDIHIEPTDTAYVIYTSGTTGEPKGIAIKQQSLRNLINWHQTRYKLTADTKASQYASLNFDAAVWEIWPYLTCGATIFIVPDKEKRDPNKFFDFLNKYHITHTFVPTPMVEHLLKHDGVNNLKLRYLLTGGDHLHPIQLNENIKFRLINHYGPSEATVVTTCCEIDNKNQNAPPIGNPILNTYVYVLDKYRKPVPMGVTGELYIGGTNVADGYVNDTSKSNKAFIKDPFSSQPEKKIYRTGDLVRWLAEGTIEYVGRIDDQVKIHGYRVETGEIESAISLFPGITQTTVLPKRENTRNAYFIAYLISTDKDQFDENEIKQFLRKKLPRYMIPSYYICIDEMPTTLNGKIDKRKLLALSESLLQQPNKHFQKLTPIEKTLYSIWAQYLPVSDGNIDDDFFDLGGDSITSLQISNTARENGILLSTDIIFNHKTIKSISKNVATQSNTFVDRRKSDKNQTEQHEIEPIQNWFFSKKQNNHGHFNQYIVKELSENIQTTDLRKALNICLGMHPILRSGFLYDKTLESWSHIMHPHEWSRKKLILDEIMIMECANVTSEARRIADKINFDLQNDLLIRAYIISKQGSDKRHLVLVAHHLIIDIFSWRILLNDIYNHVMGENLRSDNLDYTYIDHSRIISRRLENHIQFHRSYFKDMAEEINISTQACLQHFMKKTSNENTNHIDPTIYELIRNVSINENEINHALNMFNINLETFLLTALTQSLSELEISTETVSLPVWVEHHGRDNFRHEDGMPTAIGWFTSLAPTLIKLDMNADLSKTVISVKQQLSNFKKHQIYFLSLYKKNYPAPIFRFNFNQSKSSIDSRTNHNFESIDTIIDPDFLENIIDFYIVEKTDSIEFRVQCLGIYDIDELKHYLDLVVNNFKHLITYSQSISHPVLSIENFPLINMTQTELTKFRSEIQRPIDDIYPVSHLQHGFIFHQLYDPCSDAYFVQHQMSMQGNIDASKIKEAWESILSRHDILRTGFSYMHSEAPFQFILSKADLPWTERCLNNKSQADIDKTIRDYMKLDRQIPINLEKPPLIRLCLFVTGDTSATLVMSYHHILLGGWSAALIREEFLTIYDSLIHKAPSELLPTVRYKEYIKWLLNQDKEKATHYWRNLLLGFSNQTELSIYSKTNLVSDIYLEQFSEHIIYLKDNLYSEIINFAKKNKITLNTVLQGAFAKALATFSDNIDVVFGVTSASRNANITNIDRMVGLVISTFPFRVRINNAQSSSAWLQDIQKQMIKSKEYDYAKLTDIKQWCGFNKTAIFDILYLFENYPKHNGDHCLDIIDDIIIDRNHYSLTLQVTVESKSIKLKFIYDKSHYYHKNIVKFTNYFVDTVHSILNNTTNPVSALDIPKNITEENYADSNKPFCFSEEDILEPIFAHATTQPNKIALRDERLYLTYSMLKKRVDSMCNYFIENHVKPGDKAIICLPRSSDLVVTLLCCLRLHVTYIPVLPDFPEYRLQLILDNVKPDYLITSGADVAKFNENEAIAHTVIDLSEVSIEEIDSSKLNSHLQCIETNRNELAYILYTSGSTGVPKGVMITRKNLTHFIQSIQATLQVNANNTFLGITPISFDISGLEIYLPLFCGGELIFASEQDIQNPQLIKNIVKKNNVDVIQATPSTWRSFLNIGWLKNDDLIALCGGEAMTQSLAKDLMKHHSQIYNLYGPTESTIWATIHPVNENSFDDEYIPIGKPLPGVRAFVLDQHCNPVQKDIQGELYLSGSTVGQGYYSLEKESKECFKTINDPLDPNKLIRAYKTGDKVFLNQDSNLVYLTRYDDQIKIHGYRIELADIEFYLERMTDIIQAKVLLFGKSIQDKRLIAFITPKKDKSIDIMSIRNFMLQHLPSYMIPSDFIVIHNMPLTSNNKIDAKSLRDYYISNETNAKTSEVKFDSLQTEIASIWQDVLGCNLQLITKSSDFFNLGGDSLKAVNLFSKIFQHFNIKLMLHDMFEFSTFSDFCSLIKNHSKKPGLPSHTDSQDHTANNALVRLRQGNDTNPLFLLHPIGGTLFLYRDLVAKLDGDYSIIGIQDPGIAAEKFLFDTMEEMANFYISEIQRIKSQGPYLLAGASFGANMAVTISQILNERNIESYVASIDGWAHYPKRATHDQVWFKQYMCDQEKRLKGLKNEGFDLSETLLEINWHRQQLLLNFKPTNSGHKIYLLKAETTIPILQPVDSKYNHWDTICDGPIITDIVPGNHESMLLNPNASLLANYISKWIQLHS